MKKTFAVPVLVIGITSMTAQIILLREFIVVFYGNEISVGLMLACWLFLGAAGSLLIGRFAGRIKDRLTFFCALQLFLSAVLLFLIVLIRNIRPFFGFLPGEIIPLGVLLLSAPFMLAPLCVALGGLFALSCGIFPERDGALKIGNAYIFESIGAAAGGLFTGFFLIRYFSPMQILSFLSILNIFSSVLFLRIAPASGRKRLLAWVSYIWLFAVIFFVLIRGPSRLENITREDGWKPFAVAASENSIYGNVTVTERDGSYSFFTNGLHNFTVPDVLTQEESVHFALAQHKGIKEILLIGGGAGGALWEALKYPVSRVDYVELDPLIIRFARAFLSGSEYYALSDPRVNIINTDGRFFVKKTASEYDAVIINLPPPYTAQLNRFYTKEFFTEARRVLKEGGVFSLGVPSSENYISAPLGRCLGSIYNTLKGVFPAVAYIPGDTAYFIAADKSASVTSDYNTIADNLKSLHIQTSFVNAKYLFSKLSKERIAYMRSVLDRNASLGANYDFRPVFYYYDMLLWSTYFTDAFKKLERFLNEKTIWALFLSVSLIIIAAGRFSKRSPAGRFGPPLLAIGATGFSEMVFEIVSILAFQVIYGYLYYSVGLLLTSFMAGLFLGGIFIKMRIDRIKNPYGALMKAQLCVALYPMALPLVIFQISALNPSRLFWLGWGVIFPLLLFAAGFIGGLQFLLGNKVCLASKNGAEKTGGLTYGIDLMGACAGALAVSSFLIPIMGVFKTCAALGFLNLSVLLSLIFNYNHEKTQL